MLIISCLSQKGGVGKSTLARLVATTYASNSWRVKIADFNLKQKTSTDWAAMRTAAGIEPVIAAEAFATVKAARAQHMHYDIMIFDGRPEADPTSLEIAKLSDVILVPTCVGYDDLAPQVKLAHEFISRGVDRKGMAFVLSRTTDSPALTEEGRGFIRSTGYSVMETDIPQKTAYMQAQSMGRSITETAYPTLNQRADTLAQEIVDLATARTKANA